MNAPRHHILTLALLLVVTLVTGSCSSEAKPQAEAERPSLGRISPLGLGQPDPEILVADALRAWKLGDLWTFLGFFAFADAESGEYSVPDSRTGGPFSGVRPEELQPLKSLLFPMARLDFQTPTLGEPRNVRNNPPTVDVPVTLTRDFAALSAERRQQILAEVNVSLRAQGRLPVTWEQYVAEVEKQPSSMTARFVYVDRFWRLDGGTWLPGKR